MTPGQIAAESAQRARRRISRAINRATNSPQKSYVSDQELSDSLKGKSAADVLLRLREGSGPHVLRGLADLESTAAAIRQFFPASAERSRNEAEGILKHKIALFGQVFDLGPGLDWHCDPKANVRWPLRHSSHVPLVIAQGADVRVVWELNRLHHLVTLGRAYLLSGDERHTEEFLLQLASWYEANPPNFGANWVTAMEAGIRAVNIAAAFAMFRSSPNLTNEAVELILKMLLAHGRFIRSNLEFSYRTTSNHYLSDLIGLFVIGTCVPELQESGRWRSFSASRLLKEMKRQVLEDGVDYEASTGYHRLVLEIFALFFSIAQSTALTVDEEFTGLLRAMFEFVQSYLKPDGTAPTIGDSDDGRLIKLKERRADDHSYLLSIGAILLDESKLKQTRIDEEAIWWFGKPGIAIFDRLPINKSAPESTAFQKAQIFVQRTGKLYSIIDCGDHGARGRGSHAHSDALSIELFAFHRTFLSDPGTYVYTADEQERNLFRSTAYHNTVRIDGEEISQVNAGELFAFATNVRPKVNVWESTADRDVLDAEHYAYRRFASPVTHRRIVTLDKQKRIWMIRDIFSGRGSHLFEVYFNFDSGLEITIDAQKTAIARDERAALTVVPRCEYDVDVRMEPRWVSRSYGTRLKSSAIIYSFKAYVPAEISFQLLAVRKT
ncbi:MAG TPA: alginate lyase family protein [Blastocatellia bacterium]|nr:alginate lyase family protein [Blastocatellia bacterium]